MPFTVRHLGTAEYGLWMLVASLTYYFQLLDLGYGSGVVRQITDADARHDAVAAALAFRWMLPPQSFLSVVLEGATVGAIYMAVVVGVGLPAEVRRRYVGHLARFTKWGREALPG
jgi:hypothetical protein